MRISDLVELSLFVGLVVLALMMLAGAVRYRPAKLKGTPWKKRMRLLARYAAVRLPIAIGFAVAVFVLGAAALTLNSHRPPADSDPVILVPPGTRDATVTLDLTDCGGAVEGSVRIRGARGLAKGPIRFYSDAGGWQRLSPESAGRSARAGFGEEDPTTKRSLLSCYLRLPVVKGATAGYEVRLILPDQMEVDRDASVPAPGGYSAGRWIWSCSKGRCPAFAAINYSFEDGAKQVIVLVLASVFGALIALLVGDVLIEWARRRFRDPDRT